MDGRYGDVLDMGQGGPPSTRDVRTLSPTESSSLVNAVQAWSIDVDARQRGFFLARKFVSHNAFEPMRTATGMPSATEPEVTWKVAELAAYENDFFNGADSKDCYICFADPSNYPHAPGWMLRNLLVLAKRRWGLDKAQILQYRDVPSNRDNCRSIVLNVASKPQVAALSQEDHDHMPKVTGWERSPAGKLTGRIVNLAEYLDPKRYRNP